LTGDFPGEIGVCGDSTTGDKSTWGSSSMTSSSSSADSMDVTEPCETRRDARLVERRLSFPPVRSLLSRMIVKYA
jgi:hypothetical protein